MCSLREGGCIAAWFRDGGGNGPWFRSGRGIGDWFRDGRGGRCRNCRGARLIGRRAWNLSATRGKRNAHTHGRGSSRLAPGGIGSGRLGRDALLAAQCALGLDFIKPAAQVFDDACQAVGFDERHEGQDGPQAGGGHQHQAQSDQKGFHLESWSVRTVTHRDFLQADAIASWTRPRITLCASRHAVTFS